MKNIILEEKLKVGTRIKIGRIFASQNSWCKEGDVIELVEGYFDEDNGLYTYTSTAPSIPDDDNSGEFSSIYHLFGNDLEDFADNQIL